MLARSRGNISRRRTAFAITASGENSAVRASQPEVIGRMVEWQCGRHIAENLTRQYPSRGSEVVTLGLSWNASVQRTMPHGYFNLLIRTEKLQDDTSHD